jgi:hypothetical protein
MPIPGKHRDVIAEQVGWLKEAPKIPGSYNTEREVSLAFTEVVYKGADVKTAADDAASRSNREIKRKLEEFGYIDANGNILREYIVPTIEHVLGWSLP